PNASRPVAASSALLSLPVSRPRNDARALPSSPCDKECTHACGPPATATALRKVFHPGKLVSTIENRHSFQCDQLLASETPLLLPRPRHAPKHGLPLLKQLPNPPFHCESQQ